MARLQEVSLRDVAAVCRVSPMTVSRVVRGLDSVAPATRQRVARTLARLGYRPHPFVSALMTEMRRRGRRRRIAGNLAWLCGVRPLREWKTDPYWSEHLQGAQDAAAELGYAISPIEDQRLDPAGRRLNEILRARGISGIILPPSTDELDPPIDLNAFSFVRIGGKWAGVAWNKVMPDYAVNQHIIWSELRRRGLRRIGLCVSCDHLIESQGNTLAGFLFNQQLEPVDRRVPPCIAASAAAMAELFPAWCAAHRPDAVVTDCASVAQWAEPPSRTPKGRPFLVHVALSVESRDWAGIDLRPWLQGACAVELLNGLLLRNERGAPSNQQKILLAGVWREAGAPRPRSPAAQPAADPDILRPHWYRQWAP